MPYSQQVVKRDGRYEDISFDKILKRIESLCGGLKAVDTVRVAQRVVQSLHNGIHVSTIDDRAAEAAAALTSKHPQYGSLAGRIAVSNLHKKTQSTFLAISHALMDDVLDFAKAHKERIDATFDWEADFNYDFFGFKTLERAYLIRKDGMVVERPQCMLMRVALGIHCGHIEDALETYRMMSKGMFTHATPTMFNAGTRFPNLASCYLLPVMHDSIEGIFDTVKRCAMISKSAGGIGISFSNVRAEGSLIHSSGGKSTGICPALRVLNNVARYVDQGGNKRKGSFAAYLEPWHADVRAFIDLKKNHGADELRARDLFYALWIPDLFMERVRSDREWTLFCPSRCPDLVDLYGAEFEAAYEKYEATPGVAVSTIKAQDLWFAILDAQIETGTPYMLYKDACNRKSNQKNLGTIRCSNLCTEIVQHSSVNEVAVCNLASLALPKFVESEACGGEHSMKFNFASLADATRVVTRNLNRVIDRKLYPLPETRDSNLRHRPLGIGVQGLADVYAMLRIPFESLDARILNRDIFETIYFASLEASCALAEVDGSYASYEGSPASKGLLQFDLWGVDVANAPHVLDASTQETTSDELSAPALTRRWDWNALKARIAKHGLRNSLLIAPMPTASTAQILGNNECFEPFTSNLYTRRVLSGEYVVVNKHLVKWLEELDLWTEEVRQNIIANNGSVQHIPDIPDDVKAVFKTAWEMSMRGVIDQSADRGIYVDQSQSMNLFVADPTPESLTSMHFYAFDKGLKTGMYYLRTQPAADAVKVTVPVAVCRRDDPEGCEACSA